MKTLKLISIALAGALLVLSACKNDNGKEPDPESVFKVTPAELSFTKDGGTQDLTLNASNPWKAVVDVDWCTLSKYEGEKDAFIKVTVEASTSENETTAIIKFSDTRGNTANVTVKRAGTGEKPGPTPTPTDHVTDACNNTYPVVKIGEQYWMAENLKCNKYATKSEAYNASWLTNNTVPTSENYTYTPYYTDASDKSKWAYDDYARYLTDTQVKKLGYLYNWAAAVGVADGQKQTTAFSGNRQGICPNGWHVPSRAEWQTLYDYIYKDKSLTSDYEVGKYLKTTSGWFSGGNGTDTYGFAALPAGFVHGSSVYSVGYYTSFWTATPNESNSNYAYYRSLYYYYDTLSDDYDNKYYGHSVRCLRN